MDTPMKLLVDLKSGESKMVPLTVEEIAQRDVDQQAAAAAQAANTQAQSAKAALIAKLAAGKATAAEVQQALAEILG